MTAEVATLPIAGVHPFTDEALALRFADVHANDLRYVAAWGRWLVWDGRRWIFDDTKLALDRVRAVCRAVASSCPDSAIKKALGSASSIAAVERLAKADRRLAATVDQWDTDPWLLNTPGGIVNLRTGEMHSHNPEAYLTRMAGATPGAGCPRWMAFLDRVTGSDVGLQSFLQRMAGYALTGDTSSHALFFMFGTGANGKSVLLNSLAGVMGDYHRAAAIETFTATAAERHPTDLAGLRGARLVTAVETEEGRRWAEARIKAVTGGDRIAARFMRQDFFEFTPQFKLVIAGNHKPALQSVDEAIRRRFHMIPFAVTIPPSERDDHLSDRLVDEWPGILTWMIEGCAAWQAGGLAPPASVLKATEEYLEGEDAVETWIRECCVRDPQVFTSTTALFRSWKVWSEFHGEHTGTAKRLTQILETKGFRRQHNRQSRGFIGIGVAPECAGA